MPSSAASAAPSSSAGCPAGKPRSRSVRPTARSVASVDVPGVSRGQFRCSDREQRHVHPIRTGRPLATARTSGFKGPAIRRPRRHPRVLASLEPFAALPQFVGRHRPCVQRVGVAIGTVAEVPCMCPARFITRSSRFVRSIVPSPTGSGTFVWPCNERDRRCTDPLNT